MSFDHSASNGMKSLLTVSSKSAKVLNVKTMFGRNIYKSIFLDKAFQSYSFG